MKRITILALHLGYGGIEKCISTLANTLCKNYQVNVISTYKLYEKPSFPIDDRVKITYLIPDLSPSKNEFIDSVKHLKFIKGFKLGITNLKILYLKKKKMIEAIKNCDSDVIISTRDIHNDWLGKYGNQNILKIGWEHNHHNNDKKYINKIIKYKNKKVLVGGHSKGGNLAMTASMYAKPYIKRRIVTVYNNDGPGFRKEQYESKEFKQLLPKLKMFVPSECVVGFLLRHPKQYMVVKSSGKGLLQHNANTWNCYGPVFIKGELSLESKKIELPYKIIERESVIPRK